MSVPTLTPEILEQLFKQHKPHLVEIEKMAQELDYGEMEVKITVRAGVVEKMMVWSGRTWLRNKDKSVRVATE